MVNKYPNHWHEIKGGQVVCHQGPKPCPAAQSKQAELDAARGGTATGRRKKRAR